MNKKYSSLLSASLLLLNVPVAYAQIQPDIGQVLEEQKKINQLPMLPSRIPLVMPEESIKPIPKSDELRVTVKAFRFEGEIKVFAVSALQGVLADLIGKSLTMSELQEAAARITAYYRDRGYFLATTLLPRQDVTDGVVTLMVFEGHLDSSNGVKIQGSKLRIHPQVLEKIVQASIPADTAVHKESLERALLLISDLPGMSATSRLKAGDETGATSVVIQAAEGDLLVPNLSMNNYGNIYTGALQLLAGVNVNDPLGIGDQLGINVTHSLSGSLNAAKVGYSLPVGSDGFRVGASYTDLSFKLSGLNPDPQSTGNAQDWTVNASYPMIRTLRRNLSFIASYDWKRLYTDAFQLPVSNKRDNVLALGLDWNHQDTLGGGAFTAASITYVSGNLNLSLVPSSASADAMSAQTAGNYNKIVWQAQRIQRVTEEVSLSVQATGQQAGKNLDGGEKFTLGGPTGVRAYPVSEAAGDDGYRMTVEPRWNVGRISETIELQLSAFYDMGHITQNHALWATASLPTPNTYNLYGDGVSMTLTRPGIADLRVTYAQKLGSNPGANISTGMDSDGRKYRDRVWFTLNMML